MMAKRSHSTILGCIACEELSDIGGGKEGWLVGNSDFLCALNSHYMAIANKSRVLIVSWTDDVDAVSTPVDFLPDLSLIVGESITAIEWIEYDEICVVALGTSSGYLLVYSVGGDFIHKQMIHPERILKLRVRGTNRNLTQDLVEEICVVLPGAIARFDGSDFLNMLKLYLEGIHSQLWDKKTWMKDEKKIAGSSESIPYQIWNISKYGPCVDAAITGIMPPPLLEFETSQHYYSVVTIGTNAVISAFRLSETRSRSFVGAILSKVVPATFSTISSVSRMIWRREQTSSKGVQTKPQPFARASPLTSLKDIPRKGEKLSISPSGTLAVVTDSLGRILLLDTQALVVVRLWKGYRDASCLFMEMLANRDAPSSSDLKSDYLLCLAIHAPRKGIVEVWQMRTGGRIMSVECSKGSRLLQPSFRRRIGSSSSSSHYAPLEVFVFNGDSAQISVLNNKWV